MADSKFKSNADDPSMQERKNPREEDGRGVYFRDTTAILHSTPFRRLKHKTQVFFAPSNDHICTRIEHVLHVASIAATISKQLNLDTDLAWAIGLGHDLGHAPFGHVGESILNELSNGRKWKKVFQHELNSLRVVDILSNDGDGLNLSYAVRDGIVSHCGEDDSISVTPTLTKAELSEYDRREDITPSTYEAAVVRLSDRIAYLGRDYEDAVRMKVITKDDLPKDIKKGLGDSNSQIIDTLVNDVVASSGDGVIRFSDEIGGLVKEFSDFNCKRIYKSEVLERNTESYRKLIHYLYDYLEFIAGEFDRDPDSKRKDDNSLTKGFHDYYRTMKGIYNDRNENNIDMVIDYISGMTDNYALDAIKSIFIPESSI